MESTKESAAYENDPRHKGSAFIIALPESGGELLLELLAKSAMTNVAGTQESSFYHAITILAESVSINGNTYGHPSDLTSFKYYGGKDQDQDTRLTYYHLRNILFKSAGYGIGFSDRLVGDSSDWDWFGNFVQVLRDINDSSHNNPLRIVFLTCDLGDVKYANPMTHNESIQKMRDASELGDIWITKKELLEDPLKVMLKIKCTHYPNIEMVKKVIKKYEDSL